jgi:hypothetical protein
MSDGGRGNSRRTNGVDGVVRALITIVPLALVIARIAWPGITVDQTTVWLLLLAALPWVASFVESLTIGGNEVKLRPVRAETVRVAGEEITTAAPVPAGPREGSPGQDRLSPDRASYLEVASMDPNLALVSLRIEILLILSELANLTLGEKEGLTRYTPSRLVKVLRENGVVDEKVAHALKELIDAGSRALHGAYVEPEARDWALEHGGEVLTALNDYARVARLHHAYARRTGSST